jgi:hypothetical protein
MLTEGERAMGERLAAGWKCAAYREDGRICGMPAIGLDLQRGIAVCEACGQKWKKGEIDARQTPRLVILETPGIVTPTMLGHLKAGMDLAFERAGLKPVVTVILEQGIRVLGLPVDMLGKVTVIQAGDMDSFLERLEKKGAEARERKRE